MNHFKLAPHNRIDILEQSLWLSKNISIQKNIIYWKTWQNKGIYTLSDILDIDNKFLTYTDINRHHNSSFSYLQVEQIKSSIPKTWINTLKEKHNVGKKNSQLINIHINNHYKNIQLIKCKDFYWHLMYLTEHNLSSKKNGQRYFQI